MEARKRIDRKENGHRVEEKEIGGKSALSEEPRSYKCTTVLDG